MKHESPRDYSKAEDQQAFSVQSTEEQIEEIDVAHGTARDSLVRNHEFSAEGLQKNLDLVHELRQFLHREVRLQDIDVPQLEQALTEADQLLKRVDNEILRLSRFRGTPASDLTSLENWRKVILQRRGGILFHIRNNQENRETTG